MSNKLLFLTSVFLFIVTNNYIIEQPAIVHVIGFVLVIFLYYWYKKLVFFFQIKVKDFEETNMISSESRFNQICRLPVVWSNRLHYRSSPFLEACKQGDTPLVKCIIQCSEVNIHETNIFGEGAMFLATFDLLKNPDKKDASCIWALHKAGCSVNIKNKDGFTPLHLAAFKGHCSLISWLLKKGADVNIDPSPAGLALVKGHKKAGAIILAHQYKIPLTHPEYLNDLKNKNIY